MKIEHILQTAQVEYWDDDDDSVVDDNFPPDLPVEDGSQHDQLDSEQRVIVWWVVMFTVLLQTLPIRATQWLLKFLLCLLTVLGKFSSKIRDIAHAFPGTQRSQFFNKVIPAPTIASMVVYQTCHSVYQFEDCIRKGGPDLFPLPCSNCLKFNITTQLLREVRTNRHSQKLYPYCIYPTCSLIEHLKSILSRPGMLEMCEHWRNSFIIYPSDIQDSFDGKVWIDFQCPKGEPFLANKGSIGLMLNIDWFKHRQYTQ